jgi:phytoene dehydrogenase-like protein
VNTLSYTMSLVPPRIRRELELERFGYRILPLGQGDMPMRGGGSIIPSEDAEVTRRSISKVSKHDADAHVDFYGWIGRVADIVGPHDLLDRWFESPQMKGFMAVNGIIGTWAGPDAPGTAYVLTHHSVGDIGDGEVASWGFVEGSDGRGALGRMPGQRPPVSRVP